MAVENLKNNADLSIKAGSLKQFSPIATATSLLQEAVYWVDAQAGTSYIPTTASGYMYLPGVTGNYASAPDSAALDITGDIDVRCKVALDNWRPAAFNVLVAKLGLSGSRSYRLGINPDGTIEFNVSSDGANGFSASSTVSTGLADGTTKWIRATLDVNNGASGRDYAFYLSDDGTAWTQLGTTVTQSGTLSIFNSTQPLDIGSQVAGTSAPSRGKFYRAQVLNGIAGTVAFDANFETAMTSQTVASFTESSTNAATVTVNRTTYNFQLDTINNLGTAGALLPTTLGSSTAADSNDPRFLDHTGTNYVYLPGVTSNYLSVPDANDLDITGNIDLRAQVALDSWTPITNQPLIAKWITQKSYLFNVRTDGKLELYWTTDGSTNLASSSSVATGLTNGTIKWVRATLTVNNGSSQNEVRFYLSDDNITWTQLGTTVTNAGTTSIFSGNSLIEIGTQNNNSSWMTAGKIFRAQILNGIGGTTVLDVNTSVITLGSATSFTAVTGQTVTINRSTSGRKTVAVTQPTWLFGTDDYMEVNNRYMASGTYLYLPGVASNTASAPDSAALDITGDIDIRVKVALDDWTPGSNTTFISKYTSGQISWKFGIGVTGALNFWWSTNGTTTIEKSIVTNISAVDGQTLWVRVTLDVDNGASGNDVKFYTSNDGITWAQIGLTQTTSGITSIFSGTAPLEVGARLSGVTEIARGKFFRAQVLNGINGTVAFDANFETSITSLNQASFTESSANAATVTINRSGSAYRSAGITAAGYLYPGATNTFSASATDHLNFGASEDFTAIIVTRQFATVAATSQLLNKKAAITNDERGWAIYNSSNTDRRAIVGDGVVQPNALSSSGVAGALETLAGVRNVSTDNISVYVNNATVSSNDTTTLTSSNINPMRIARMTGTATNYSDAEIYAAAVWRRRLLGPEIGAIFEYFNARD